MAEDVAHRQRAERHVALRAGCDTLPTIRDGAARPAEARERALRERCATAQRLESMGVLAGGFAHDFNNHLTSILGFAELAQESSGPTSQVRRFLDEIHRATQRAADLVHDMLAMVESRPRVIEPLDLVPLVDDVLRMLSTEINARGITLRRVLPSSLSRVEGDTTRLRQVILNLVLNAVQSIQTDRGDVEVRLTERRVTARELARLRTHADLSPGRYVVLSVADRGRGMEPAVLKRAFDPFFTTKRDGHGLGLAAALDTVQQHGAGLLAESATGVGTRIQILFPPSTAPHARHPAPLPTEVPEGTGCILVVDDEHDLRHIAEAVLAAHGYDVLTAARGEEALAWLRERGDGIHGVLLDLTMPGMGGAETFYALRRLARDLPVIVTTGFGEAGASRCFEAGRPSGFLQKPYNARDLLAAVGTAVHAASPHDS